MRAARRIVTIVLLVQVAWALPLGLVLGITIGWSFLLAFAGAALAVLAVLLSLMLMWQRADARRDALLATGTRAPAMLVASRASNTRINNRTVLVHSFEAREAGRVIRAETKAFVHLPIGAEATIAYDTTDSAKAVVVEDLDQVAADGQVDWQTLQQRAVDRRFRRRS
jgi:hypothetical protein